MSNEYTSIYIYNHMLFGYIPLNPSKNVLATGSLCPQKLVFVALVGLGAEDPTYEAKITEVTSELRLVP